MSGMWVTKNVVLHECIGMGGMGSVWRAEHMPLGIEVAVKFIAPELLDDETVYERFRREARAAARVHSPHVVKVFDHGTTDEGGAIAEEYRKGRRLYIGTVNLDAGRPVIWNIGEIAGSDYPGKIDLIHDVLQASAAYREAWLRDGDDEALAAARALLQRHVDDYAERGEREAPVHVLEELLRWERLEQLCLMEEEAPAPPPEMVGAPTAIPIHYNTWPPIEQDVSDFAPQGVDVKVLEPGDSWSVD